MLVVTGCASRPIVGRYLLSPPASGIVAARTAGDAPRMRVDPVHVPEFMDSTDILLRQGPGELVTLPTARWGERLSAAFRDALRSDLRARLPGGAVVDAYTPDPEARRLAVSVAAFDAWTDGHVVLVASWTLSEAHPGRQPAGGQGTFSIPAAGQSKPVADADLVAAMSAAVAALAAQIAQAAASPSSRDTAATMQ